MRHDPTTQVGAQVSNPLFQEAEKAEVKIHQTVHGERMTVSYEHNFTNIEADDVDGDEDYTEMY